MKLIICIDNRKGMMFFGKRQSQDHELRRWIINRTLGSKLWMSTFSSEQFQEYTGFIVDDDYNSKAALDDYCFVEDKDFIIENTDEVILCCWNRKYQADRFFDVDLKANGFFKTDREEIKGSSHNKITIETYRRIKNEKK